MLINGLYDTAIRRLPCAIVFWGFAGYLWRGSFPTLHLKNAFKGHLILQSVPLLIHCIIAIFFFRILLGDYYYMKSFVTTANLSPQSGKQVKRALEICPFHPEALYQAAYIGIQTEQFDYTIRLAELLDKTAPHYRPTSFLKGLCAFGQKRYGDALNFVNEEIEKNPNYINAKELKIKTLAKLGKCKEMSLLQNDYRISLRDEDAFHRWGDTISSSTLKKMYIEQTGRFRALAGGSSLREAFRHYIEIGRNKATENFAQYRRIVTIPCERKQP
jgi:tetratricopeptide (TPR) repeat protein